MGFDFASLECQKLKQAKGWVMFRVKPKQNARWFQLRSQASRFFFWLGRKIDPKGPYTNAHMMDVMTKAMIDQVYYGQSAIRIEHVPIEELFEKGQLQ